MPGDQMVVFTAFGNAGPGAIEAVFSLTGTNLPPNVAWQASCADARLPQPFSAAGIFSASGSAALVMTVPPTGTGGDAQMTMAWTFTNPGGQPFPAGAAIRIDYYQIPTATDAGTPAGEGPALAWGPGGVAAIAARDAPPGEAAETVAPTLLASATIRLDS